MLLSSYSQDKRFSMQMMTTTQNSRDRNTSTFFLHLKMMLDYSFQILKCSFSSKESLNTDICGEVLSHISLSCSLMSYHLKETPKNQHKE